MRRVARDGAIESLLCARVADKLTPELPRHDPNQELMAQGIANIASPLFGGMPATGTIARTVTNIRSGARSPVREHRGSAEERLHRRERVIAPDLRFPPALRGGSVTSAPPAGLIEDSDETTPSVVAGFTEPSALT